LSQSLPVIEGVDGDGLEEGCEPCLACAVAPHLGNSGVGGVQGGAGAVKGGEHHPCGFLAPIDRDQETGVEDHSS
jgi:hypothetical protein